MFEGRLLSREELVVLGQVAREDLVVRGQKYKRGTCCLGEVVE